MARIEELKDVPLSELDKTIRDYKDSGATNVQFTKQPDGNYMVTATFPD